jgi:hypothetical protein
LESQILSENNRKKSKYLTNVGPQVSCLMNMILGQQENGLAGLALACRS